MQILVTVLERGDKRKCQHLGSYCYFIVTNC